MEFNSKGCILSCGPDPVSPATTVTYKKLYGLYNVPEMGERLRDLMLPTLRTVTREVFSA